MRLTIIIGVITAYTAIGLMRLDALDRTAIYYTLYGARSFNITASPYTVIDTVWGFVQIPLRRSTYFSEWCEGGLYSSYLAVYNPSLCSKMNDKM